MNILNLFEKCTKKLLLSLVILFFSLLFLIGGNVSAAEVNQDRNDGEAIIRLANVAANSTIDIDNENNSDIDKKDNLSPGQLDQTGPIENKQACENKNTQVNYEEQFISNNTKENTENNILEEDVILTFFPVLNTEEYYSDFSIIYDELNLNKDKNEEQLTWPFYYFPNLFASAYCNDVCGCAYNSASYDSCARKRMNDYYVSNNKAVNERICKDAIKTRDKYCPACFLEGKSDICLACNLASATILASCGK